MANATFLQDALVAQPAESAAWLEQCLHDSCDAVASDVASAITALKLARDLAIKHCAQGWFLALQAVSDHCWLAGLDVVDADAGGLDFKRWVDTVALDGRQFVCAVDNDNGLTLPRGQHSFTARVNVITPDSTVLAVLHLPAGAVTVGIHGDDTAT